MKKNTGFTLIELLVVIAIIGILSSVVLASLNTARAKGADAAIKSNLANMRAQAELVYDTVETGTDSIGYDGVCANTTIAAALTSAGTSSGGTTFCLDSTTAWAVAVPLKSVPAQSWCVDSTGASKERTGNTATTAC